MPNFYTKYKAQCVYQITKNRNFNFLNVIMEYMFQTFVEND